MESLIILTGSTADEQFVRLCNELDRRHLSYTHHTLVFDEEQDSNLELTIYKADGTFEESLMGEQIFSELDKIQKYIEAQESPAP